MPEAARARLLAELDKVLALSGSRRLQDAAAHHRRCLASRPGQGDSLQALAMIAQQTGRLDLAEPLLRSAVAADPSQLDFVGNLGNLLRQRGRMEQAADCYRKVLAVQPDSALAHNNLGNVLQEQGDLAEAVACYRRALETKPDYLEAWSNLGGTLQKQKRSDEAVAALERALAIDPNDSNALLNMGTVKQQQGAHEDAIACFNKVLAMNPNSIAGQNKLQRAHLDMGDYGTLRALGETMKRQAPRNQMTFACEAFADLAQGDRSSFLHLYGDERLIHSEVLDAPPGFDGLAPFNEALVAEIMSHPALKWIHDSYDTTRRGFVYSLLFDPTPTIAQFGRLLLDRIEAFRTNLVTEPGHPFLGNIPERFSIRLWTTILNAGGYHPPHHHEHNWLSGVYYAKVPRAEPSEAEPHPGWIEFDGFTGLPGLSGHEDLVRRVQPAEGMLVLFPSYVMHGTRPFSSDDTRISLAFDIAPRP